MEERHVVIPRTCENTSPLACRAFATASAALAASRRDRRAIRGEVRVGGMQPRARFEDALPVAIWHVREVGSLRPREATRTHVPIGGSRTSGPASSPRPWLLQGAPVPIRGHYCP